MRRLTWFPALVIGLGTYYAAHAQTTPARALLEQSAAAMGGLDRLRSLDNVVLTGFGLYQGQLGGGDLSPDARAPHKYQVATDAQRAFDLKNKRALVQDRRASLFPFAAAANPNRNQQLQTGVAMLDHPLTALLAALDSATKLGAVTIENGKPVVEFSVDAGPPLRLALDPATHLPAWVRWISASDTLGDVTNTAYFTGYLPFDGVQLPTGITTAIDWRNITTSEFQVDSYQLNAKNLPAFPPPRTPPPTPTAESSKIADGVWDVRYRGDAGAVIEFKDHLTMFEAYASEAATFARLDLANTLVPGKKVTEVIVSHHHFDHSGGLRAAVARGLTIISRRANEEIFREMVARPAPNFPGRARALAAAAQVRARRRAPRARRRLDACRRLSRARPSAHGRGRVRVHPRAADLARRRLHDVQLGLQLVGRRVSRQRRALRARSRDQHPGARQGDDFQGHRRDHREAGCDREEVLRDEREGRRLSRGVSGAVFARRGALTCARSRRRS